MYITISYFFQLSGGIEDIAKYEHIAIYVIYIYIYIFSTSINIVYYSITLLTKQSGTPVSWLSIIVHIHEYNSHQ